MISFILQSTLLIKTPNSVTSNSDDSNAFMNFFSALSPILNQLVGA